MSTLRPTFKRSRLIVAFLLLLTVSFGLVPGKTADAQGSPSWTFTSLYRWGCVSTTSGSTVFQMQLANLTPGLTYHLRVRVYDASNGTDFYMSQDNPIVPTGTGGVNYQRITNVATWPGQTVHAYPLPTNTQMIATFILTNASFGTLSTVIKGFMLTSCSPAAGIVLF